MLALMDASQTLRCHTLPVQRASNLAEHSYGVALLCDHLSSPGRASAALLRAALHHDLHECETGDVPHPVKRKNAGLSKELKIEEYEFNTFYELTDEESLSDEERRILRIADMLEFLIHCRGEWLKGNTRLLVPVNTALESLIKYGAEEMPRALDLILIIKEEMSL